MARWNHSESFPNSVVKRCCGDDSCRVADRQNSSMPGSYNLILQKASSVYLSRGGFLFFIAQYGSVKAQNHVN